MTIRIKIADAIRRGVQDPLGIGETHPITAITIAGDELVLQERVDGSLIDFALMVLPISHPTVQNLMPFAKVHLTFRHGDSVFIAIITVD